MENVLIENKLVWKEESLYNPKEVSSASMLYEGLDARHKEAFKKHSCRIEFEVSEEDVFPEINGFPTDMDGVELLPDRKILNFGKSQIIEVFRAYISPRYTSLGKDFLNDEFPFHFHCQILKQTSGINNHINIKTVEDGKKYAELFYAIVMNKINNK